MSLSDTSVELRSIIRSPAATRSFAAVAFIGAAPLWGFRFGTNGRRDTFVVGLDDIHNPVRETPAAKPMSGRRSRVN
jgi:hypothetical protein